MSDASEIRRWWDELERLGRVLGRVGPDEVCCGGLTQRQTFILRILVQQEGARLSDLAQAAGVSPSAMTRILEKLERQGLVRRVRGAQDDGRAAMVRITPEGRRLRARLDGLMRRRSREIMAAVPAADRARVLDALRVLNGAMESAPCCGLNTPVGSAVPRNSDGGRSFLSRSANGRGAAAENSPALQRRGQDDHERQSRRDG